MINLSLVVEAFASFTDWAQRRFAFPPQEVQRVVDFPPPGVATFSTTTSRSLALNSLSLTPLLLLPPHYPSPRTFHPTQTFFSSEGFVYPLLLRILLPFPPPDLFPTPGCASWPRIPLLPRRPPPTPVSRPSNALPLMPSLLLLSLRKSLPRRRKSSRPMVLRTSHLVSYPSTTPSPLVAVLPSGAR